MNNVVIFQCCELSGRTTILSVLVGLYAVVIACAEDEPRQDVPALAVHGANLKIHKRRCDFFPITNHNIACESEF